MLGPLLVRDGADQVILASGKQRALLAVLLLESSRGVVGAERLIDELWGVDPPATAGKALQVHVSQLRRTLGPGQPIVTRPTGYAIEIEPDALDLHRFDALVARARRLRSDGDDAGALAALDAGLGLWRGRALADVTLLGPGAVESDRLEGLQAVALEERMELELRHGSAAALVPELEALVAAHPYRERMHGLLMLALYRAGRQADALEAFRRARTLLVEELGLEPGPGLVRLEASILAQDPALLAGGDRASAGSARSARDVPGAAIPRAAASILGRDPQLRTALELIDRPEIPLVTLTGPGGIGKTRLAVELAERLGHERSRLVELAAIDDPGRVLAAIGATVGAEVGTEAAVVEALSREPLVLFLDNFEQVLAAAPMVASLLAAVRGLTVVVTSRAPLRIAGEHELPVPPLPRDSAVELFVRRAREQDRGFAPNASDLERIASICARIDGLPLAIELAAARVRVLEPAEILERIGRRLDLLTAGRRDAPERHRTLRATIAWSHDLLEPDEQRLFAQLAVFRGGWSVDAAEAVAGRDVLDSLSALVDHALVIRDRRRFGLLETVREYATERLSEAYGDASEVRRRHARWCQSFAEAVGPELEGPEQARAFTRLDAEEENLRAAAAWAVAGGEPEIAMSIGGALWRFWLGRGAATEMLAALSAALTTGAGDPVLRATAANAAGILAGTTLDVAAAKIWIEEALELAIELGDRRLEARALTNLGVLAMFAADYATALEHFGKMGELWRELGNVRGQSVAAQNIGLAHFLMGDVAQSLPLVEKSVELAREANDGMQIATTLHTLGRILVFHRLEDPRIPSLLRESLERSTALGERHLIVQCLEAVAHFAVCTGAPVEAAELIGAVDAERERAGATRPGDEIPFFEQTVGALEQVLGRSEYERARERGRDKPADQAVAFALEYTAEQRAAA